MLYAWRVIDMVRMEFRGDVILRSTFLCRPRAHSCFRMLIGTFSDSLASLCITRWLKNAGNIICFFGASSPARTFQVIAPICHSSVLCWVKSNYLFFRDIDSTLLD